MLYQGKKLHKSAMAQLLINVLQAPFTFYFSLENARRINASNTYIPQDRFYLLCHCAFVLSKEKIIELRPMGSWHEKWPSDQDWLTACLTQQTPVCPRSVLSFQLSFSQSRTIFFRLHRHTGRCRTRKRRRIVKLLLSNFKFDQLLRS